MLIWSEYWLVLWFLKRIQDTKHTQLFPHITTFTDNDYNDVNASKTIKEKKNRKRERGWLVWRERETKNVQKKIHYIKLKAILYASQTFTKSIIA